MKKHILFYMLMGCILALTACSDDDYSPSVSPLKVTESKVSFNAKGGQGEITVTSATPIASVESSDEWCEVTLDGDYKVKVSVGTNGDVDTRNSVVTIKDKEGHETHVAVSQSGLLFFLDKHKNVLNDGNSTSYLKLVHSNDVKVSVEEDADWLKAKVEGDSLVFTLESNATGDVRSAYVYCESGPRKDSVLVVQGETKDILGDYYFAGYDNKNNLRYLKSTLSEGKEAGTLNLTFAAFNTSMAVDYDEENMVIKFKGGQYLGDWTLKDANTGEESTTYVYTVVWDTNQGYLTWADSYSMDGIINGDPTYGTLIDFEDNGSWSGYEISAIRFELFSKQEAVKANRLGKALTYLVYPFMQKIKDAASAKFKKINSAGTSLSLDN